MLLARSTAAWAANSAWKPAARVRWLNHGPVMATAPALMLTSSCRHSNRQQKTVALAPNAAGEGQEAVAGRITCACWVGDRGRAFATGHEHGAVRLWSVPPEPKDSGEEGASCFCSMGFLRVVRTSWISKVTWRGAVVGHGIITLARTQQTAFGKVEAPCTLHMLVKPCCMPGIAFYCALLRTCNVAMPRHSTNLSSTPWLPSHPECRVQAQSYGRCDSACVLARLPRLKLSLQDVLCAPQCAVIDAVPEEDALAPPAPAAVPRHTLHVTLAAADAEPVRALTYVSGEPVAGGEALLVFGGQPVEKPDILTLLPLPTGEQVQP